MSGRTGQIKRAPIASGKGRPKMWQTMRIMRQFTVADIESSAEVTNTAASKYVRFLHQAGYLRCVQAKESGRTGGHARYQLLRNTGPHAPRIGKRGVRDPNVEPIKAEPTVTIPRSEYERALRCINVLSDLRAYGPTEQIRENAAQALEVSR
ncbi:MAG TPA: hypothetical protein VFJ01_05505 [Oleiagrimonas sp.]|nr:hypothetical protein [Oleiagrimonas sp.]